jgi:hypothetical protein
MRHLRRGRGAPRRVPPDLAAAPAANRRADAIALFMTLAGSTAEELAHTLARVLERFLRGDRRR